MKIANARYLIPHFTDLVRSPGWFVPFRATKIREKTERERRTTLRAK